LAHNFNRVQNHPYLETRSALLLSVLVIHSNGVLEFCCITPPSTI
jgi:hypothetical protein